MQLIEWKKQKKSGFTSGNTAAVDQSFVLDTHLLLCAEQQVTKNVHRTRNYPARYIVAFNSEAELDLTRLMLHCCRFVTDLQMCCCFFGVISPGHIRLMTGVLVFVQLVTLVRGWFDTVSCWTPFKSQKSRERFILEIHKNNKNPGKETPDDLVLQQCHALLLFIIM